MLTLTHKNGKFYANDTTADISDVELTLQANGWCKLPENNSSNRTWIKGTELEKIPEGQSKELPYREKQIRSASAKKTWFDFLTEEQKEQVLVFKAIGLAALEEARSHVPTQEEKDAIEIAKLEAKLAALKSKKEVKGE